MEPEEFKIFNNIINTCAHIDNAENFCKLCKSIYCEKCKNNHAKHLESEISYSRFLNYIKFNLENYLDIISNTDDKHALLLKKIDKCFEELIESLKKQRDNLKENLKNRIDNKKKISSLDYSENLKNLLDFFRNDAFIQQRRMLVDKANEIIKSNLISNIEDITKNQINLEKEFAQFTIDEKLFEKCFANENIINDIKKENLKDQVFTDSEDEEFVYNGEALNGKPHGFGKAKYESGSIYEGEFVNGKAEGKGKYYWYDGRVYIGDFKNDKAEAKNGKVLTEGRYKNDKYIGK